MKKKVGILGGTFDPIHNGHLLMAEIAREQYVLDEIWFVPTGISPHKDYKYVTDASYRCNMIRLAIKDKPYFKLNTIELSSEDTVYTYRTLERLYEENDDVIYYFIMGADSLFYFEKWMKPERILELCTILVAVRDDMDKTAVVRRIDMLKNMYDSADINLVDMPNFSVSSADIRKRLYEGHTVRYMVHDEVVDYIMDNDLYTDSSHPKSIKRGIDEGYSYPDEIYSSIIRRLKRKLDGERFMHTLGVMYTAGNLAGIHAPELMDKALMAGLLHDCAKCIPNEDKYRICRENGIELNEAETNNPGLVHAKLGEYIARAEYGIDDVEIGHAISVHTTGCPDMSTLDKIVYLADFIEPARNAEGISIMDEARKLAFEDLDSAVGLVAKRTVSYLEEKGAVIDDTTQKTADFYNKD